MNKTTKQGLKTIAIKGKDYVQVNDRVQYFRESFSEGWSLQTEIISLSPEECVVKAWVTDAEGRTISVGHAHEEKQSSYINKTSYIENCETSAIGRCLGFLNIGIDSSIASAEEVVQAVQAQEAKPAEDDGAFAKMLEFLKENPDKWKTVQTRMKNYNFDDTMKATLNGLIRKAKAKATEEAANG